MNTNTYGANFKHKTNFGPIVVFADEEKSIKPYEHFDESWNQYISLHQNDDTGQWYVKPNDSLGGEYGDFIIDANNLIPEGNIIANQINFFLTPEQEQQFGDLLMDYYVFDGKLYLQANANIDMEAVLIDASSNNGNNQDISENAIFEYNPVSSNNLDAFVTVFISSDGAKLERAYQQITSVKDREVVIFAEKNDRTNVFGSVFRVLSGNSISESSIYPKSELSSILRSYTNEPAFNPNALKDLISLHFKDRDEKSMFLWVSQMGMSFIKVASDFTLEPLGDAMFSIAGEIGKGLKLADYRWKAPVNENSKYEPLLPGYKVLTNENTIKTTVSSINTLFVAPFSEKINTLIYELKNNELTKHFIGNSLDGLSTFMKQVPKQIEQLVTAIFKYFKDAFEFYNALLVGIINSLVDLLKSIFEILGLIFKGLHAITQQGDLAVNKTKSYLGLSIESLENVISILYETFTVDNLLAFIGFQIYILESIGKLGVLAIQKVIGIASGNESITIPYDAIGYYTGYVIGWIAQEIVVFMLTAGTGTIAKATQAALKSYADLGKVISNTLNKTANIANNIIDFTVESFLKALQMFKDFAKQIPQHLNTLKSWMDELIANLKSSILLEEKARLLGKFPNLTFILIDEALSILKLTLKKVWRQELDEVGLQFAKNDKGGMAFVYKNVELFNNDLKAAKAWLSDLLNKDKRGGKSLKAHLDELARAKRKKLRLEKPENLGKLGKNGEPQRLNLVNHLGKQVGQLVRGVKGNIVTYSLKLNGNKRKVNLEVTLFAKDSMKYELPINQGESLLYGDLYIPKSITDDYSGIGSIVLDDALAFFSKNPKFGSVDGVYGVWLRDGELYKEYGGQSINLEKFWTEMEKNGGNVNEAVLKTFTGNWAKTKGFDRIAYKAKNIRKEYVIIKFLK